MNRFANRAGLPAVLYLLLFTNTSAWPADPGQAPRTAFVHLFEWKWPDVARECEQWLGPKGFAAVQISPPQEHRVVSEGSRRYPWWQRYQPVSYKLGSRSGSRQELEEMISRCNQAGVKVYADLVIRQPLRSGQEGISGGPLRSRGFPRAGLCHRLRQRGFHP